MQANFSHTTSLSHNCHCFNVSHVFIVSVTALFLCILYLFLKLLWTKGLKHTAIQTVIELRNWEGKFGSDTWYYIVKITGRCVQHQIYLHSEKVWGATKSSVGGTTHFKKQHLQFQNTAWEIRTLRDTLQLTLAAILGPDRLPHLEKQLLFAFKVLTALAVLQFHTPQAQYTYCFHCL
jgi:hypothetical protein